MNLIENDGVLTLPPDGVLGRDLIIIYIDASSCHSERSEESLFSAPSAKLAKTTEILRYAQNDNRLVRNAQPPVGRGEAGLEGDPAAPARGRGRPRVVSGTGEGERRQSNCSVPAQPLSADFVSRRFFKEFRRFAEAADTKKRGPRDPHHFVCTSDR